eukprot:2010236-Prymnesium_polylepis.1
MNGVALFAHVAPGPATNRSHCTHDRTPLHVTKRAARFRTLCLHADRAVLLRVRRRRMARARA